MPVCKNTKYVGRDVVLEFAIGCGDVLPLSTEWMRMGAMRTKNFGLEWETADGTADDSIGALREAFATYQALTMGGDGLSKVSGVGAEAQRILTKHVINPIATGGQPTIWMRMTFKDLTFIAFMLVTSYSREAPNDDLVSFSIEASSTGSDFGLIVEDTPDPDAPAVVSVTAYPAVMNLAPGASSQATAIVAPVGAPSAYTWSSDTPAVATVTQLGVVTAVSAGEAEISATSSSDTSKKGVITVTVA